MMILRITYIFLVFVIGLVTCNSHAIPVSLSECIGCPINYPIQDPCEESGTCSYRILWCSRSDTAPYVINPGTLITIIGTGFECQNCFGCPDNPPPAQVCLGTVEVEFEESVTVNVSSQVTVGYAFVESSLYASIGHVSSRSYSFSLQTGPAGGVPPCKIMGYAAQMDAMVDIETGIDHSWTVGGVMEIWNGTCCIENAVWQDSGCDTATSTADGSAWLQAYAVMVRNDKCKSSIQINY